MTPTSNTLSSTAPSFRFTNEPCRAIGPSDNGECIRRKRGTQRQAIGRSRGGLTTKIVALVDALGNLVRFLLLPAQAHDIKGVSPLIRGIRFGARLADTVFDANWLLEKQDARGATAVIPPK